jgi:hypothetical protein
VACRRSWAAVGLLLLAGCAAPGPGARPADFPEHAARPHFDLHWRIERQGDRARAVGIAVPRDRGFSELLLQLRGIDGAGRAVSQAVAPVMVRGLTAGPAPFEIGLPLTGAEVRFEVWVWGYLLEGDPDHG